MNTIEKTMRKSDYIHAKSTWYEGERSTIEPKTIFRRSAEVSLRPSDLIHPHDASDLPNYCGYVPQRMFHNGRTYGATTDRLTRRHTRNEKLVHTRPDNAGAKETFLPVAGGDRMFTDKMVPGYTGFVPQHTFKYGETYKEGTEAAICQTKRSYSEHAAKLDELQRSVNDNPKLQISANCPKDHPGHPMSGHPVTFMFSYNRAPNTNLREFTEPCIPGTMIKVPQMENNILGERYSVWNGKAYEASKALRDRQETVGCQVATTSKPMDATGVNPQCGQIYNKYLGMVPKYTGYIPQRRFDYEKTYGDSTRSLPCCKNTGGYAGGEYIHTGPPIDPKLPHLVRDTFLHKQAKAIKCGQE